VPARDHVVLVHGMWMRGLALLPLAQRLQGAGFSVEPFEYASAADPGAAIERLTGRIVAAAAAATNVHVLGHSLGGLLALEALRGGDDLPPGYALAVGSPLCGSAAARGFALFPGGAWMIGRSLDLLEQGLAPWTGARRVGVIAGSLSLGFGLLTGLADEPGDGTVAVRETRLPGISEHRVVAASHTGLLFSSEVAALCAGFLREGSFAPLT
jgi:hypothetical protein